MDETGHSFRARVAPTWAPTGQPPLLRRRDKRREVSSIVALVAPGRTGQRARLYARHQQGSIDTEDTIEALRYFRRVMGHPLLVVWDRLNQHRSHKMRDFVAHHRRDFRLAWLPPYAPDLNPEEGCNGVVKAELRNATPDSAEELRAQVRRSFQRLGRRPATLAAFIRHAGLRIIPEGG